MGTLARSGLVQIIKKLKANIKVVCHSNGRLSFHLTYLFSFLYHRHAIYSPSRKTLFKKKVFPAVEEYLYNIEIYNEDAWDGVKEQLSLLVSLINSAKDFISDFGSYHDS